MNIKDRLRLQTIFEVLKEKELREKELRSNT